MDWDEEYKWVNQILEANKTKGFVDRILNSDKYPTMKMANGQHATHKMAWMTEGKKHRVFPTVLYDGKELKEYPPRDAYEQARQTGNYIEFDNPEDADRFSKRYKIVWGE